MDLDFQSLRDAIAELGGQGPMPLRFQVACPRCAKPVWTSQDRIGHQINCLNCDATLTVETPESFEPPGTTLTLIAAGSQKHRSLYAIVEQLELSPSSSLQEMLVAFHNDDQQAEALRQLRDAKRRFAHDLLCYPYWHNGNCPHGPE